MTSHQLLEFIKEKMSGCKNMHQVQDKDVGEVKEFEVKPGNDWVKATLKSIDGNAVTYELSDGETGSVNKSNTRVHDPLIKNIRNRLIEISNQMRKDWKLGTPVWFKKQDADQSTEVEGKVSKFAEDQAGEETGRRFVKITYKEGNVEKESDWIDITSVRIRGLNELEIPKDVKSLKKMITTDTLDNAAHAQMFQRFDTFNKSYDVMGCNDLRTMFLKTDNKNDGKYFADLLRKVAKGYAENNPNVYYEPRLTMKGIKKIKN